MTRQVFIQELEQLHNNVIKMGSIVEQSMNDTILALENIDVELAKKIIIRDDEIDLLEQNIERDCINIIAKQQPIASDLRKITSIMKIITDIERMADHCADISEYIIDLNKKPKAKAPENLDKMVTAMKKMVIDTIDSFVTADLKKANNVIASDDEVDEYFNVIRDDLISMMQVNKDVIPQCVDYLMIIKYLERMADHATNIAEWITFIVTGDLVLS
ncbi:PhoU-like phosphate uptake regulator [Mobilisporobacter senegalensis]|uniref:Phosphate-specific transport system accessory protein PhoU n=1 Tax=Mobilisporobacter senegalensis TaxID=1329262 RepID=A0A3N1XNL2_9FIRM|nr:phosphate signaling complex protein PhoU [Mobilisporobacter senegalensis]ROR26317.1 PhoU-like phosphate uptake regulator [Mobilisporobacter senegalensis]